jgi:uncharacterized protein YpbB
VLPLWKSVWRVLKNLKTDLPYDPIILPWKVCKWIQRVIPVYSCLLQLCSLQLNCRINQIAPKIGKNKENYLSIYLSTYLSIIYLSIKIFSAIQKNEIMSFTEKWLELEMILLSKISQAQKANYHMFSLICGT